jgi:Fe-S cluster assembly protein SufD
VLHAAPAADGPAAHYPRLHVEVADGVEATLIEEHAAVGEGDRFVCPVTTVAVGANATFTHLRLQREPGDVHHVASLGVQVGRDARYRSLSVALGAALSRLDLRVRLEGPGAETSLDGLYALADRQVSDHHTFVDHAVAHTASRQRYKGLLGGHARGIFHGRILIRHGAAPVSADQGNDNLLLSDDALVNTNPELEIFADDVACRHGATIGRLDADRLFYLRSRGIPRREAERLLVRGFVAEVLEGIADETLREEIRDAAAAKGFAG